MTNEMLSFAAKACGIEGNWEREADVVSLTNQRDYEYVRAENAEQERDQLRVQIKQKDAEIAELVAALEDNWNCNPCETTRQQKAFDAAQSILAKVRKP